MSTQHAEAILFFEAHSFFPLAEFELTQNNVETVSPTVAIFLTNLLLHYVRKLYM
jgi:hypothetical protein